MSLLTKLLELLSSEPENNVTVQEKKADPPEIFFTNDDMEQFDLPYQMPIFSSKRGNNFHLNINNQYQANSDINLINSYLEEARQLAHIKCKLFICTNDIDYSFIGEGQTELICTPYTKTGKKAKYPLSLNFYTNNFFEFNNSTNSYKGEIYYMQDGSIGKARIVCRVREIYIIHLGLIGSSLKVKRIETIDSKHGLKTNLYKA